MSTAVLFPLRLFLALGWLRAGVEKLIAPEWWTGDVLHGFLREQRNDALPFFRPVMDHVIAPGAVPISAAVLVTQIGCGLALVSGRHLRPALFCAVTLNITFVLAGRVNPSVFYLVMEFVLIMAVAEGAIGSTRPWPTRRVATGATGLFASALVLLPFVRTLEPSNVIADPALVLVTLFIVSGLALSLPALAARPSTSSHRKWMAAISDWLHAVPSPRPGPTRVTGPLPPPDICARTDNLARPDPSSSIAVGPAIPGHLAETTSSFPPPLVSRR